MQDRPTLFLASLLVASVLVAATGASVHYVGHFSAQDPSQELPAGWKQIQFGHEGPGTTYDLVRIDSTVVVRARSSNSASGLITSQQVDLQEHPILEWRWKVNDTVAGGDVTTKDRNDAAARLYVTFEDTDLGVLDRLKRVLLQSMGYGDVPSRALNYLWSHRLEKDTVRPSAYTDQIMLLPVRRGSTATGMWVQEQRNVLADYRKAFGEDPPPVSGVAIMTDTENTGDTIEAFYGDIVFRASSAADAGSEPGETGS